MKKINWEIQIITTWLWTKWGKELLNGFKVKCLIQLKMMTSQVIALILLRSNSTKNSPHQACSQCSTIRSKNGSQSICNNFSRESLFWIKSLLLSHISRKSSARLLWQTSQATKWQLRLTNQEEKALVTCLGSLKIWKWILINSPSMNTKPKIPLLSKSSTNSLRRMNSLSWIELWRSRVLQEEERKHNNDVNRYATKFI